MNKFTDRVYNFNAGPSMLPIEVMKQIQEEFLNYNSTGMSIIEMSHRGPVIEGILEETNELFRRILTIPKDYSICFFSAGATLHFSGLPLNLLEEGESADYTLTGTWGVKSYEEAKKFNPVNAIFDGKTQNYTTLPDLQTIQTSPNAKYLHIVSNNTIYGTAYHRFPKNFKIPITVDMTSDLFSRRINVSDFGVIFAGAQKNFGPSGFSALIIKNDLLKWKKRKVPVLLDYELMVKNNSMYNTPSTFGIYVTKLVLEWIEKIGGLDKMEIINREKSEILYKFIDNSSFFYTPIKKEFRSRANVVFLLKNKLLDKKFEEEAEKAGLVGLTGHRSVGGFRASIYNPMPIIGVRALIDFMEKFEKNN